MGWGYAGKVTLRSPDGEVVTIKAPGLMREYGTRNVVEVIDLYESRKGDRDLQKRQHRRLRRLLSAGYKVIKVNDQVVEQKVRVGEQEKKNTDLVIATTQSGDASHGGKHASAEVKNSPNAAKQGEKSHRGNRGGRKSRQNQPGPHIKVQRAVQSGTGAVYAPQPLTVTPEILKSAEKSAELLAELVGKSHLKVERGVRVNALELLIALEIGDDPIPPLEDRDERQKLKVLVTPDCSGSTQNWNGLGQAWALFLSQLPDVDIVYIHNSNGVFWEIRQDAASQKLIHSVDVVLYLGDADGQELCEQYASWGATVLAMDCHLASVAKPRLLRTESHGRGTLYWVDRVSAHVPDTWAQAIVLCLKK